MLFYVRIDRNRAQYHISTKVSSGTKILPFNFRNGSVIVDAVLIFKTTTKVITDSSNNVVTTDWTSVDILHEIQVIITVIQQQDSPNFPLFTQIEISVDISIDIISK